MRWPVSSSVCSVTNDLSAKVVTNEMRSDRLTRLSVHTLVHDAMKASAMQSMRMVECDELATRSPLIWSVSQWQVRLSSVMPPKRLSRAVSCTSQLHGPWPLVCHHTT